MFKAKFGKQAFTIIVILFFVISSIFFIFSPISFKNIAMALNSSDYNKSTGDSLGVADWNRLDEDFVAKSGDTISGNLDVSGNLNVLGTCIGCGTTIETTAGIQQKMICGKTPLTLTNTTNPINYVLHVDVNTSIAGFNTVYSYISNMTGIGNHYRAVGADKIYSQTPGSYQLYIQFIDNDNPAFLISPSDAVNWGWVINWCGIGT